ncbi:MAG: CoA transferase [Gemmatimonadaceae bacterium]
MSEEHPLAGVRAVSLAVNVPGPVLAARLRDLGAMVTKVEPPNGDFLAVAARAWYDDLCRGQRVVTMNLKEAGERRALKEMLAESDVLIMSSRPSALARLGLSEDVLQQKHRALCVVSIVGHAPPHAEAAGHDLTYQSDAGLIEHTMPATLIADMAAAEEGVSAALALLYRRTRTGRGGWTTVSLRDAALRMALPRRHGMTVAGGILGGALPEYGLYETADGTLAVAALERHFSERLRTLLQLPALSHEALAEIFAQRSAREWGAWGLEHDVPMLAVTPNR